jgi:ABC-2 type transport system ATP-binding protein
MAETILEVKNLVKDYGDFVLDKISFEIPRGVVMGLIGENGAGKSTTINCILNEVQKSSGQILLFGKDHIQNEIEIKDKIGVVFDENFFPDIFTPSEIGSYMSGIYRNWESFTFREYLKKFELPETKAIKDFSKGMKVKLVFAVALSHKAELLILDEATSGLDPIIRDDILDLLLDFVQDETHAVLVSSHITSDLEKIADYITFIHKGRLVFSHPKDDLVDNYGIISCGAVVFDSLDKSDIIAYRKEDYQFKVLVKNRHKAEKNYPKAIVEPAAIEDIMLFYVKGELQ